MKVFKIILSLEIAFLILVNIRNSKAQVPPDKSLAEEQHRRLFKKKSLEKRVPKQPEVEVEEKLPEEAPPKAESTVKFLVTKIIVEGSTVFTQEELHKITSPYENRELTLDDLNAIAKEITELYRKNGYITSKAYIPPQKIKEGVVKIKIFEGKVGDINIQGNRYFGRKFIAKRFEHLRGKILNQSEILLALLYLNKNPDLTVKASLMPSKEPAFTDIVLSVTERYPHHMTYLVNNLGGKLTRRVRHTLLYTSNNFLGYGDYLSFQFPWAESGVVLGINTNYVFPLDEFGRKIGFSLSYTTVKIGREYKPSKVRSASDTFNIYYQDVAFQTLQSTGEWTIGFEATNSYTRALSEKIIRNKLRVLNMGFVYNAQDRLGRTNISAKIDFGFPDFLGSSEIDDRLLSPGSSTSRFVRYTFAITRLHILPLSSYVILSCQGQITPHKLPSVKRLYIGGAYSVRGYPEDDVVGDYGINTIAELRMPFFILPDNIVMKGRRLKDALQLALFSDMGAVYVRGAKEDSFLLGTGIGLRLLNEENVSGRLDLAWPLGDKPTEKEDYQIHFALALEY